MSDNNKLATQSTNAVTAIAPRPQTPPTAPEPADAPLAPRALSEAQLAAAELLVLGMNDTDVAERLNVHRHTVARWRANPDFQRYLDDRHLALYQGAPAVLAQGVAEALAVCRKLVHSPTDDRMKAIRLLLGIASGNGVFRLPARTMGPDRP